MAVVVDKAISKTIYKLFKDVIDSIKVRYSVSQETLAEAIVSLRNCFRHLCKGKTPVELPFNKVDYCLGYLNRYALLHSVMVKRAMNRVFDLEIIPDPVLQVFSANYVNIVSLGGASGNDLVGLLSSLYGRFPTITDIDITVMDKNKEWAILFLEKIDLLRNGSYGAASQVFQDICINTDFVQLDLQNPNHQMEVKIGNANVVLLVKVFSNIPDLDKAVVFKNIVRMMKQYSLLIYIDTPDVVEGDMDEKLFEYELSLVYELYKKKYSLKRHQANHDSAVNKNSQAKVQIFRKM